jgi:hypothetical protein
VINHDGKPTIVDTLLAIILKMGQEAFHFYFCLKRQPIISLWQCATCRPPDYPWYLTNNCWRSIDAHFHDGAERVLQSVLTIKAAKNDSMTDYSLSEVWFPRTHDQQSLMLRWRSFSWWGRGGIAICFKYKGSQKFLYDWIQPIGGGISQVAGSTIGDTPLTLIFMMGHGRYCNLVWL